MIILAKLLLLLSCEIKKMGSFLQKGFFEQIHVKTTQGQVTYYYLFGKRVFIHDKGEHSKANRNNPVIYFTVNKNEEYVVHCVQKWVDIAHILNSDICFVCDNKTLEYKILKNVIFYDKIIRFIPRIKKGEVARVSELISTKQWVKACQAHLTSFYEAQRNGYTEFWKIDADDTILCMPSEYAARALQQVIYLAREKDMSVLSMDMWHSRTKGTHWSWGISFVRENVDYCDIFKKTTGDEWSGEKYKTGDGTTNIDWFFTYLKMEKNIKCETFYIDKSYFIHYGNFLKYPRMVAAVYKYSDNMILYPIYRYVFDDENNGYIKIAADDYKISVDLTERHGRDYLIKCIGLA